MNGSKLSAISTLIGLFFIFSLYACTMPDPHRADYEFGKAAFKKHCASCHGETGVGDGPIAPELEKPVPDLTLLSSRFDGVYPAEYVLGTIDGRQEFLAHGTRMMPIWGNIWRPDEQESHADVVEAQRIMNGLLYYMESIQVK